MAERAGPRNSPAAAAAGNVILNLFQDPPLPLPGAKYHFATMIFWLLAAACAALAVLAGWADHRRANRRDVDKPGWVPWQPLLVLAMIGCVVCVALGVLV
jgi:hypothetical protein